MPTPTPIPNPSWIDPLLRFAAWIRRRLPPDHSSLYRGFYTRGNFGGYKHIYIIVACAPSRRFRKPRVANPDRTLTFLEQVLPGSFGRPPALSSREVVAFEIPDDPSSYYEAVRAGRVNSNGCVEVFVRVPIETDPNGALIVDLVAAMKPVDSFVRVVKNGGYRQLYVLRSSLRRLDWYVALSNAMSDETGRRQWDDLRFPGRRPLDRATHAYPAAPQFGLASRELRNSRQRTDPSVIVQAVLDDLLTESGWHDGMDEAIADTLEALA